MTENIQFNEEQYASNPGFQEKNSRFAQMLINWGLASDGKSANIILIGIAIVFFGVSVYFFLKVLGFVS
jgi:hypothetical protein